MDWNYLNRHGKLNVIFRALDVFNFPNEFSPEKKIESVRILIENQALYSGIKNIPNLNKLYDRLLSIYSYLSLNRNVLNRTFLLHEINDIAIQTGWVLPDINEFYIEYKSETKTHVNKDTLKYISSDNQNVHHSKLNKSIKDIAMKIVKEYPEDDWNFYTSKININSVIKETLKRINESKAHFNTGITLKELFLSICKYIELQNSERKDELQKRLYEELIEMTDKCLTGHFSRLVNVLQGFEDKYAVNLKTPQKTIYEDLTTELQVAPEHVKDSLLSKDNRILIYIEQMKNKYRKKWEELTSRKEVQKIVNTFFAL